MQHNGEVKKMKTKQVKKETMRPIKPFKTIAEEAEYWDIHSILDDINEGTTVGLHQANKTDTLTIRFLTRTSSSYGKRRLSKELAQAH